MFGALSVKLVDVDDDDDLDLISVGGGGGTEAASRSSATTATARWPSRRPAVTSNNPLGLAVGDLNSDGRVDLAIANRDTSTGATHLQREDGTFAAPPTGDRWDPTTTSPPATSTATATSTSHLDRQGRASTTSSGSGSTTAPGRCRDAGFVRWEDFLSRQTSRAGDRRPRR